MRKESLGENELRIGQNIFLRMKNDFGMNLSKILSSNGVHACADMYMHICVHLYGSCHQTSSVAFCFLWVCGYG